MKTTQLLRFCALTIIVLLPFKGGAQFQVVFKNQKSVLSIALKGVHIAEDKNYVYTIEDALAGKIPFVESKNHTLNFGNTVSRHWIHFKVQNPSKTSLYVKFLNSEIEDLNIHIVKHGVVTKKQESGLNKAYTSRFISANTIVLPLDSASDFEVYLFANSPTAFWCPMEMGTINAIVDDNHFEDIFNGAFIGIMVIMFLYNFLVWILLQDRVYLIYCLYMLSGFAFVFTNKGFHLDLIWRNYFTWPNIAPFLAITVNATGLWFSYTFLKVKRHLPSAVKFYIGILAALSVALVINILHYIVLVNAILQIVSTANSALLITCGIIIYNRGQKQALYYIIAWSFLVTGATIFSLMLIGLLPVNGFTLKSFQVALVIEACLLSLALANRINIFRKEAVVAQKRVADIALENEKLIREQNVVLETKVKERTLELTAEKKKSDDLLLNILPSEIADELKIKGKADAREFELATILFTDFKEFTQAAETLSAQELVTELNACFELFDKVTEKYNIEKIKTIGDAYMAVGGIPIPSTDSVKNTVLAALEMQESIRAYKNIREMQGKHSFEMRVGIHTGPVIACIVGYKKFQYDIWGDSVNTASRMESAGEIDKVNISETTYNMIKDDSDFVFEKRGKVIAKHKGEVDMYFVHLKPKDV